MHQMELLATFTPTSERAINYNALLRIRNKPAPLFLNVKGEGYALATSLELELPDGGALELSPSGVNQLDLGQVRGSHSCRLWMWMCYTLPVTVLSSAHVQPARSCSSGLQCVLSLLLAHAMRTQLQVIINDRIVRSLALINSGRVNCDFAWDVRGNPQLCVRPAAGSIPKGERRITELSYAPTILEKLHKHVITCQACQCCCNGNRVSCMYITPDPFLEFFVLIHSLR
jgi:hypothetical protein